MAIFGAPFWNDRRRVYFSQENNAVEHILSCRLPKGLSPLETCGPTASVACQAALGREIRSFTPGGYSPQPEDLLSAYLNDPRNFEALRATWPGLDPGQVAGNEVAQWYPLAVREVFNNACEFAGALPLDRAISELKAGRTLQACLRSPGHFVAIVAYDDERDAFLMSDGWGSRWPDGDGFGKALSRREYLENLKPATLIYS